MKFNQTSKQYRQLNDFIRGELKVKNISQKDLAYMLNLPQSGVSDRLSGKTDWTLWEILNVFAILNINFNYEN